MNFKQHVLILVTALLFTMSSLFSMDEQKSQPNWRLLSWGPNYESGVTIEHVIENREMYIPVKSTIEGLRAFQRTDYIGEEEKIVLTYYFDPVDDLVQSDMETFVILASKTKPASETSKDKINDNKKAKSTYWPISPKILGSSLLIGIIIYVAAKYMKAPEKKIA